ncbi:MAG: hypothetical protein PHN61_14225, partial [Methanothrix sp.]|nr:hypothetical protein [Methanothrix sp.]
MNTKNFLLTQIRSLNDNLNSAKGIVNSPCLRGDLRDAVQVRFSALIEARRESLSQLRGDVQNDLPLETTWNSYLLLQNDCACIFRECLAFLEGALVRGAGLDDEICYVADDLLNEMSDQTEIKWSRLTILGEREFFDQTAEIIRLRFPDFSIWRLPIVAHEFGHLAEQELRDLPPRKNIYPIRVKIEALAGKEARKKAFLQEFFSDLFGVYAMGPAFACASI